MVVKGIDANNASTEAALQLCHSLNPVTAGEPLTLPMSQFPCL